MISHLKQSFLHLLDQNEWMDPDTKRTARTKVSFNLQMPTGIKQLSQSCLFCLSILQVLLMREKIGYPDYILNQTALLQEFPIQVKINTFPTKILGFRLHINLIMFTNQKIIAKLHT